MYYSENTEKTQEKSIGTHFLRIPISLFRRQDQGQFVPGLVLAGKKPLLFT